MCEDEILAVRRVRHQISEECGHDVDKVAAYYESVGEQLKKERAVHPKGSTKRKVSKGTRTKEK